jgi:hypothetical protein
VKSLTADGDKRPVQLRSPNHEKAVGTPHDEACFQHVLNTLHENICRFQKPLSSFLVIIIIKFLYLWSIFLLCLNNINVVRNITSEA